MRVLLVTNMYTPDECGVAQNASDLAVGLAERGHAVTVRCAYPYYPEWRDKSGQNGIRVRHQELHGVHVERYGLHIPRRPNKLTGRVLQEGSFFVSLARSVFRGRHDVAVIYCPLMSAVAFGAVNQVIRRVPAVLCVQDLPTDAAVAGGIMRAGSLSRWFNGIERWLFGRYAAWRTIHPIMAEQLRRRGQQPIYTIPDWISPTLAKSLAAAASVPAGAPNGHLRLLYSANIGTKQSLPDFCKALSRCRTPFEFRINGAGGGVDAVRAAVNGDPRFELSPLTPEAEFAHTLRQADLYVVTERPNGAAFFPSKTIPSMAVGTPVLAVSAPTSPLGVEMRTHGIGPLVSTLGPYN